MRSYGAWGLPCLFLALGLSPNHSPSSLTPTPIPPPPAAPRPQPAHCPLPLPQCPPPLLPAVRVSNPAAFLSFPFKPDWDWEPGGKGGSGPAGRGAQGRGAQGNRASGLSPPLAPTGGRGVSLLAKPLTHHLRGGGVSGEMVHSKSC